MAKDRKTEIDVEAIDISVEEETPPSSPSPPQEETVEVKKERLPPVKIWIVTSGITLCVLIGVGVGFYLYRKPDSAPQAPKKVFTKDYYEYQLDTFFLPLPQSKGKEELFLKLNIQVQVKDERVIDEIKEKNFVLRENLYAFLKKKGLEEVTGKGVRDQLNKEILLQVNKSLESGPVDQVIITEFFVM